MVHESAAKPSESATKPADTDNRPTENSLSLIPNMLSSFGEYTGEQTPLEQSMFYPDNTQAISWSPSQAFHSFLEKPFRRKLSYEQVCDILEQQAIPAVDALSAPTLDISVINQSVIGN